MGDPAVAAEAEFDRARRRDKERVGAPPVPIGYEDHEWPLRIVELTQDVRDSLRRDQREVHRHDHDRIGAGRDSLFPRFREALVESTPALVDGPRTRRPGQGDHVDIGRHHDRLGDARRGRGRLQRPTEQAGHQVPPLFCVECLAKAGLGTLEAADRHDGDDAMRDGRSEGIERVRVHAGIVREAPLLSGEANRRTRGSRGRDGCALRRPT